MKKQKTLDMYVKCKGAGYNNDRINKYTVIT